MEPECSLPHSKVPSTCSYPEPDQSNSCPPFCLLKTHVILSSHWRARLPNNLSPSGFPFKTPYAPLLSSIRATCTAYYILLNFITWITFGEEYRSLSSSLYCVRHSPVTSFLLGPNILPAPYSQTPSAYVPSSVWATMFHSLTKR